MVIHYMTGKEDNLRTTTKAGCGKLMEDMKKDGFVFWNKKHKVNCDKCLNKIEAVLKLQGKLK